MLQCAMLRQQYTIETTINYVIVATVFTIAVRELFHLVTDRL